MSSSGSRAAGALLARTPDFLDLAGAVEVPAEVRGVAWDEVRRHARAARATRLLSQAGQLLLPDLIIAEVVYVLESVYRVPRPRVAELVRAIVAFPAIEVADEPVLLRALEVYEVHRLDFADAYLVAEAETSGVNAVASFDKTIERVPTVRRVAP
jgi:predicted nucleic-acid-binding protein